jgi:hypothetical protein
MAAFRHWCTAEEEIMRLHDGISYPYCRYRGECHPTATFRQTIQPAEADKKRTRGIKDAKTSRGRMRGRFGRSNERKAENAEKKRREGRASKPGARESRSMKR